MSEQIQQNPIDTAQTQFSVAKELVRNGADGTVSSDFGITSETVGVGNGLNTRMSESPSAVSFRHETDGGTDLSTRVNKTTGRTATNMEYDVKNPDGSVERRRRGTESTSVAKAVGDKALGALIDRTTLGNAA